MSFLWNSLGDEVRRHVEVVEAGVVRQGYDQLVGPVFNESGYVLAFKEYLAQGHHLEGVIFRIVKDLNNEDTLEATNDIVMLNNLLIIILHGNKLIRLHLKYSPTRQSTPLNIHSGNPLVQLYIIWVSNVQDLYKAFMLAKQKKVFIKFIDGIYSSITDIAVVN